LLKDVYNSLRNLRHIFHDHPLARTYNVPEWYEKMRIKLF
jgi:hypothetical protein